MEELIEDIEHDSCSWPPRLSVYFEKYPYLKDIIIDRAKSTKDIEINDSNADSYNIDTSITWDATIEGLYFWDDLYNGYVRNVCHNYPEFKHYFMSMEEYIKEKGGVAIVKNGLF